MPDDQHQTIDPAGLPPVITRYLAAHRARDTATALTTLTEDATVTDDGKTYEGVPAIADWLGRAASEYTYTTELTAAQRIDPSHYIATHHLEGDFPGGQVDLRFRFTLRDDLIEELVIEP
ncbi:nuclear transport factor 2 family protein [Streptomyces sp. NPDC007084]|uniref:nuclear transport factor 2 family protein n=1 Tax=Streptomyces sp. NPDC007084 TaxID=3154313 RepID=UPI00345710E3